MQWKIGDKVRLKSGGPSMTVGALTEKGNVECWWFGDHNATPKYHAFKAEMLEAVKSA